MKELLRARGFKITPQRELIFRTFFDMGRHVSADELSEKVRRKDRSIGHSTVWRTLKLICTVGLAQEVIIGDGITRYDRITRVPHGHLFCLRCKELVEFDAEDMINRLDKVASDSGFEPEGFKVEIQGYCKKCRKQLQEPGR